MRGTFCITRSTVAQSLAATALCCCSLTPSNILATRMKQLSSAQLRYNHATPVLSTKHAEVLIEGVLTAMLLRQTQGRKFLHHNDSGRYAVRAIFDVRPQKLRITSR